MTHALKCELMLVKGHSYPTVQKKKSNMYFMYFHVLHHRNKQTFTHGIAQPQSILS